jgi:hypothetical protein
MFRTGAQLMFLTLIVGLVLMRESEREPVNAVDERVIDFLAANARRKELPAPVTLVGIDEVSLKEHPLPWTPGDYALFFNAAVTFKPEVLATDEILDWNLDKKSPEIAQTFAQYAQMLRENIRKSPRTVLGAELSYPEDADRIPPLESIAGLRNVKGAVALIPNIESSKPRPPRNCALQPSKGSQPGQHITNPLAQLPCSFVIAGRSCLPLCCKRQCFGRRSPRKKSKSKWGRHIRLGERVTIPIDAAGRMRVNLALPIGRCSFEDLVVAAEQKDANASPSAVSELFTAHALLLSRTDRNVAKIPVTLDQPRPRGEFFALALGTIQNRSFIHSVPWWTNWAFVGFFTAAAAFVPYTRRSLVLILGSVSIFASLVTALGLIGTKLIALPVIVPIGLTLFLVVARFLTPDRMTAPGAPSASPATPPVPAAVTTVASAEQSSSPATSATPAPPSPPPTVPATPLPEKSGSPAPPAK